MANRSSCVKITAMEKYKVTIGLEVHAELRTRTKMFCDSKNDPDEKQPNVNICPICMGHPGNLLVIKKKNPKKKKPQILNTCPICMGHPGTLPVINKEAVKHVLRIGAAVGGKI